MNPGFFSPAALSVVKRPEFLTARCGLCGLHKGCESPKMEVAGEGKKSIMIVGEWPREQDDQSGKHFSDAGGQLLRRALESAGIDMRRDCWMDMSLRCRPPGDYLKDGKAVDYCRPHVMGAIKELRPEVIILLGGMAIRSVIGRLWREDTGGSKKWAGFRIPCRDPNSWVCPTFAPQFVMREKRDQSLYQKVFIRHLKAAAEMCGERPWTKVPDYTKDVELIFSPDDAAARLSRIIEDGGPVAFDYETTCLKPDGDAARIVSCSVCLRGKETIAYPWAGGAIKATRRLLMSRSRKIASNMKFEERWTRAVFGDGVRNWHWDTMAMAHVIDARPGISGLKFQAFARLGQEDYDYHLKPLLESKESGGNAQNRIKEVDLKNLLMYNALDSLLEYKVAVRQCKELGVPL